ncbi:MAG: outer membrane protein assembly factor [Candidatus Melainabacteria bacterium]
MTPLSASFRSALAGALVLMLLLPAAALAQSNPYREDDEDQGPTPVNEFAPDDVRESRGATYDQGVTINKISIEGNRLIDAEKIKSSMLTRPGTLYSKSTLKKDLKRIYDMGYFTEQIKAVPVSTNSGIHLRIQVTENAPVTGINIDGNTIINDGELQEIFAGQTGMPQNIGQLNESIEQIEKLYAEKGYVLARVTSISDDPDGTINLSVNEGKIDHINFVGNRKTKDFVIKRSMTVKEGDVYNEKKLSEDLKRVFSSQAFSDVRRVITASPDNPDEYNLTVEMDEKKTGAISLGGGVDTSTGFFGSVGYNDPNFLGRGQNFNSMAAVGSGILSRNRATQANTRSYQFEVGWSDPSLFETDNSLSASAYGRDFASFNVPLGVERRIGTEVSWARPLLSVKNTSVGLGLKGENVRMREYASDSDLAEYGITKAERRDSLKGGTFLTLSPTLAYDSRDNRFNPTSGLLGSVSLGGSMGLGGGSYGTATANIRKYIKIRDGITLALNSQAGTNLLGDIPEFNMFRVGGAYSVRGFQEGGLGTGNGFLMGSAEVRAKVPMIGKMRDIPILNSLSLASFMDAGTLFDQSLMSQRFDRPGLGASIGAGIRVNIPGMGPVRVDYAVPILGGGKYTRHINFGVGQIF